MSIEEIKEAVEEMGKKRFGGSVIHYGFVYGKMPFKELENISFYRHGGERLKFIAENITGKKRILDLGCNCGHYSFALAKLGHDVIGLDYDEQAIKVASTIAKHYGITNTKFICADMLDYDMPVVDVILFLSTYQWIAHQVYLMEAERFLKLLKEKTKVLFFETAGSDSIAPLYQADNLVWIASMLNRSGYAIEEQQSFSTETGKNRTVFKCLS